MTAGAEIAQEADSLSLIISSLSRNTRMGPVEQEKTVNNRILNRISEAASAVQLSAPRQSGRYCHC
jgi:hypothetical protein